jgi:hypothetical protein
VHPLGAGSRGCELHLPPFPKLSGCRPGSVRLEAGSGQEGTVFFTLAVRAWGCSRWRRPLCRGHLLHLPPPFLKSVEKHWGLGHPLFFRAVFLGGGQPRTPAPAQVALDSGPSPNFNTCPNCQPWWSISCALILPSVARRDNTGAAPLSLSSSLLGCRSFFFKAIQPLTTHGCPWLCLWPEHPRAETWPGVACFLSTKFRWP